MAYIGQSPKGKKITLSERLSLTPRASDPTSPAEGDLQYADGTARPEGLWIYTNGAWVAVDSGASDLQKNYAPGAGSFESGVGGWSLFTTTFTGGLPTTITGGAANLTFAASSTNPLRGNQVGLLSVVTAAGSAGMGVITDAMTIDDCDLAQVFEASLDYRTSSGSANIDMSGTSTQTFELWVYNVGRTSWYQLQGFRGMNTKDLAARLVATMQTDVSDATNNNQYRLALIIRNAPAGTCALQLDNVYFGRQQPSVQTAIITDWVSFTPTGSFTNTTYTGRWRRVGDSAEVQVRGVLTGTPGAATLTINYPSGLVADTAKLVASTTQAVLGEAKIEDSGTTTLSALVAYSSTTSVVVQVRDIATHAGTVSTRALTDVSNSAPYTWAINDSFTLEFKVPIVGWSSTVQADPSSSGRVVAARMTKSASQTIANNTATKVTFNAAPLDTTGSFDDANDRFIVPESGVYDVFANLIWTATNAVGNFEVMIYVDGSEVARSGQTSDAGATLGRWSSVSSKLSLNAGQQVEIWVIQATGASRDLFGTAIYSYFTISKVSGSADSSARDVEVSCIALTTAGQSIPNNTLTTVVFGTRLFDSHNALNLSTGVYTVPVSGRYQVDAIIEYSAATTGVRTFDIVSSAGSSYGAILEGAPTASVNVPIIGTAMFDMFAGQTLDIRAFQTRGSALSLTIAGNRNFVTIKRIS